MRTRWRTILLACAVAAAVATGGVTVATSPLALAQAGATGDTFTASANGDLNGDGTLSTFSIQGAINSGTLNIAPNMLEINPEE